MWHRTEEPQIGAHKVNLSSEERRDRNRSNQSNDDYGMRENLSKSVANPKFDRFPRLSLQESVMSASAVRFGPVLQEENGPVELAKLNRQTPEYNEVTK